MLCVRAYACARVRPHACTGSRTMRSAHVWRWDSAVAALPVRLQRELALEGFKDGRFEVLVCTDIAGRGAEGLAAGVRASVAWIGSALF